MNRTLSVIFAATFGLLILVGVDGAGIVLYPLNAMASLWFWTRADVAHNERARRAVIR